MAGGSVSIFDLNLGHGASVGKVKAISFLTKLFRFKVVESKPPSLHADLGLVGFSVSFGVDLGKLF